MSVNASDQLISLNHFSMNMRLPLHTYCWIHTSMLGCLLMIARCIHEVVWYYHVFLSCTFKSWSCLMSNALFLVNRCSFLKWGSDFPSLWRLPHWRRRSQNRTVPFPSLRPDSTRQANADQIAAVRPSSTYSSLQLIRHHHPRSHASVRLELLSPSLKHK